MELSYHATYAEVKKLAYLALQQNQALWSDNARDNFKYDPEMVRPKLFNFKLDPVNNKISWSADNFYDPECGPRFMGANELELGDTCVYLGYNSNIWLAQSDIQAYNDFVVKQNIGLPPIEVRNNIGDLDVLNPAAKDDDFSLIVNLDRIGNIEQLRECGVIPSEFLSNIESRWSHDANIDKLLRDRLNVNIIECGGCCTPFVRRDNTVLDDKFYERTVNIYMPPSNAFSNQSDYYSTIFHELTHITVFRNNLLKWDSVHPEIDDANHEIAAELGSCVLLGLFEHKEPSLSRYSTNYINHYYDQSYRDDLHDVLDCCAKAVMNIREALPEIEKYDRAGNLIINSINADNARAINSNQSEARANQPNQITSQTFVQLRRHYLAETLPEIKYQMKQQILVSQQEQQAKAQSAGPAGKKLGAAQLEQPKANLRTPTASAEQLKPQMTAQRGDSSKTQQEGPAGKKLGAAQLEQPKANLQTPAPSGQTKAHSTQSGTRPNPARPNESKNPPNRAKELTKRCDMER